MSAIVLPLRPGLAGLTAEYVRYALNYNSASGEFNRAVATGRNCRVGAIAGSIDHQGYRRISLLGKLRAAHQLAWLTFYGIQPSADVDHINGDRADNRIANLRLTDHSTNLENQRAARRDNKLGVLGVRERYGKFEARIWVKGSPIYIGLFSTVDAAASAYKTAKRELHAGCTV